MRELRPIRTEADYEAALAEVAELFDIDPPIGSPEGDRFEILLALLEVYEQKEYPIPESDPVEILHYAIRDLGRSQAELAEILGSRSRASEILNRRRALTVEMIEKISAAWHIPAGALAKVYPLTGRRKAA
jgi:HTH-type transcriptional regulator / antitoxin HigA